MYKHLNDLNFLTALVHEHCKTQHVRLKVFDKHQQPIEYIEGKISGGSINIDGAAAIRRTCSLNVIADSNSAITDKYWSLTHEFEVEIGLENKINPNYDPIVWFPMGHYLINNFSKNVTTNNTSISISGQDLMAKLNGTQGGNFPHEIDFAVMEKEQSDGSYLEERIKLETIIEQALCQYGQERLSNIRLLDLPDHGLELLEYRGKTPMYLIIEANGKNINIVNYSLQQDVIVWDENKNGILISEIPQYWGLGVLDEAYNRSATKVKMSPDDNTKAYNVVKLAFGSAIGYRKTDLVYAGDLTLKAGDNVNSLLTKIKDMLGVFEYFYDTDGVFVLQKKKDYLQELFSPQNGDIVEPLAIASPYVYEFHNDELFTAKALQPKIDNIKNDFVIWSKKASASGGQLDIHARYAIDEKPKEYRSPWEHYEKLLNLTLAYQCKKIDNNFYLDCRDGRVYLSNTLTIIYNPNDAQILQEQVYSVLKQNDTFYQLTNRQGDYQFSLDEEIFQLYQLINENEYQRIDFNYPNTIYESRVIDGKEKPEYIAINTSDSEAKIKNYQALYFYIGGNKTYIAYEHPLYYLYVNDDNVIKCDWRELIYQMAYDYSRHNQDIDFYIKLADNNPSFEDGRTGYEQYYADLLEFWRALYNPHDKINCFLPELEFEDDPDSKLHPKSYWNKKAYTEPDTIVFWFDFLDVGEAEIGQYSVRKIGIRQKVDSKGSNNTNIFLPSVPEIIYDTEQTELSGYKFIQIPEGMEQLITTSAQGLTVIEQMNNLIYEHSYATENVNLTVLPMFWLQPNTRIYVEGIGDLVISKLGFQLTHNGTMNLTCTKVTTPLF